MKSFIQDAGYDGKTLIGNITGSSGTFARVATVRNESGRHVRHRQLSTVAALYDCDRHREASLQLAPPVPAT